MPRGLLFVQAIQADAGGYRNGDSDRAERQAGFIACLLLLSVLWLWCGLLASTDLFNHGGLIFVVPSLWLPMLRVIVMRVAAHRCRRYRQPESPASPVPGPEGPDVR